MARQEVHGWHRIPPVLVVGGLTLGVLMLCVLQFAAPYYGGLWGLVLVAALDLLIFLELRVRRSLRKQARRTGRGMPGAADHRGSSHALRGLEDGLAGAVAVLTFAVGFYVIGLSLGSVSGRVDTNPALFIVGLILVGVADGVGYLWPSPVLRRTPASDVFDTTDDH